MAKVIKLAVSASSKLVAGHSMKLLTMHQTHTGCNLKHCVSSTRNLLTGTPGLTISPRSRSILSHSFGQTLPVCSNNIVHTAKYSSSEVNKEISKFLEKEIKYEVSRSSDSLPKVSGFEIKTDGGDVTFTKTSGSEKITVKLSVNNSVDAADPGNASQENEPPKMVSRPPFEVEIAKGGTVLALQCSFPSHDDVYGDEQYNETNQQDKIDDQFEIEEVAIHGGEWKDQTYSVAAATMDAELFDLLMDLLDERGINDEFIVQLVDFCTAYENKQYIGFLQQLKSFVEK